ncbi:hypothetical protein PMAYCL1PPCAC_02725 [Pristionchus mayeri]|uniref:Uncharacterized protein n=1 Tax=Pristionchus mayeri TaxID=1317129 RepID=A0AAN4Z7A3_9BILA|nr:hypothetical protein PMAYCL1PPCAC_02725 [Pristionchus mayeri]
MSSSISSTATPSTLSSSHQTETERALSPTPSTNDRICPFSIALLLLLLQSLVVILLSCLPPSLSGILSLGMALFVYEPDPPTPAASDQRPERTKEDRDAFTAARDAHYENQAIEAAAKKAEIDRFL